MCSPRSIDPGRGPSTGWDREFWRDPAVAPDMTYAQEWQDWKATRERDLAQPYGWLALVSLDWLADTPRTYGDVPGVWWQDEDAAYVDPQGAELTYQGAPITDVRRFELVNSGEGT